MVDKIVSLLTATLIVAGLTVALRPGSNTVGVVNAAGNAWSKIITASTGGR